MADIREEKQSKNCPSCGAPIVSEICAYCGAATGLNTDEAGMEYPVLECKEADISFWTVGFPMIFAAAFGLPGIIVFIIFLIYGNLIMLLTGVPFILIGGVALWIGSRVVSHHVKLKRNGKMIQGTVYGYMDDDILINDKPAQIVKLLVQTPDGPRFILYQLGNTLKPYCVNDRIDIMVWQNYFMICKNK